MTLTPKPLAFTYDLKGNLRTRTLANSQTTYSYDYENKLTQVLKSDGTRIKFAYDFRGRRVSKSVIIHDSPLTSHYSYDGDNLIAEYDSSGNFLKKYFYGPSIDEIISSTRRGEGGGEGVKYFYHSDSLGSIIDISDSTGSLIEHYGYDAFGSFVIRDTQYAVLSTSQIGNTFTFTGREFDSETGLYYYRARYYDPKIGRFLQRDPLGYSAGINLYSYCSNNPVNYVDPSGKVDIVIEVIIGGLVMWDETRTWREVYNNIQGGISDDKRSRQAYEDYLGIDDSPPQKMSFEEWEEMQKRQEEVIREKGWSTNMAPRYSGNTGNSGTFGFIFDPYEYLKNNPKNNSDGLSSLDKYSRNNSMNNSGGISNLGNVMIKANRAK